MQTTGHERKRFRDLAFLISGIAIGSAIALLLAPSSGEDLRYEIAHGYRRATKKIGRRAEELRERAEGFMDRAGRLTGRGARLLQMRREKLRRPA
jgi:gas vesicle protein